MIIIIITLKSNSFIFKINDKTHSPPPDNILMDFTTGQITHIDFSVCFGRGETLRVPETVPFRLTQNLETALGVWTGGGGGEGGGEGGGGVNGIFRVWGEGGLEVVRENKGCLMELLGSFLWDPLEEWGELWVGEGGEGGGRGGGELGRVLGDIYTQMLGVWVGGREKGGMEEAVGGVRDTFWSLGGVLGKVLKEMEGERKEKEEKDEWERKKGEKEGEVRGREKGYWGAVAGYRGEWGGWGEGWKEKKGVRGMLEQALGQCELWQNGFEGAFSSLSSLPSSFSSLSSPLPLLGEGGREREGLYLTLGRVVGGEGGRGVFGGEFSERCLMVEGELVGSWEGLWREMEDCFILLKRYKGVVEGLVEGLVERGKKRAGVKNGEKGEKKGGDKKEGGWGEEYKKLNKCTEWSILIRQILHRDTLLSPSPPPLPPPPSPPSSSSSSSSFPSNEIMEEKEEKKLKEGMKVVEGIIEKGKGKELGKWLEGVVEGREGREGEEREKEKERKYMKILEVSRSFCDNCLFVSCLREILEREEERGREGGRRGGEVERQFWEFVGLFFFYYLYPFFFFFCIFLTFFIYQKKKITKSPSSPLLSSPSSMTIPSQWKKKNKKK